MMPANAARTRRNLHKAATSSPLRIRMCIAANGQPSSERMLQMPKCDFFIIPMFTSMTPVRLQVFDFVAYRVGGVSYWSITILNFVFVVGV